jgi:tetratricopeptide (TPR) repeat protein
MVITSTLGVYILNKTKITEQEQDTNCPQNLLQEIKKAIQMAKFGDAISHCQLYLSLQQNDKNKTSLLYLYCVALRLAGQLQPALVEVNKLLNIKPKHARAFQEKGHIYLALGNDKQAASAFYQATRLNPTLVVSWRVLRNEYIKLQQQQAADVATAQIDFLSQLPTELLGARDLLYEGELYPAEQVCRRYLTAHKHHVEGMLLLAEIGIALKVFDDAEFLLESCVELAPSHFRARYEYLNLLTKLGKFKQAQQQADILLEQQSDNHQFKLAKATAMMGLGQLPEAIMLYQLALQQDPQRAGVHLALGHAQKALGEFDAAIASYQQSYTLNPAFGDAYWSLANTKTYKFTPSEIAQMKEQESAQDIPEDDRIHLCFALGKALEDKDNYAQSFAYYQTGNRLKSATTAYDPDKHEQHIQAQIKHCSEQLFTQRSQLGCDAPDPIFIVGLPRAGSTLLEQILASHPMVDGTMELHNILGLASKLRGHSGKYPANLHDIDGSFFRRFGEQFIQDTRVYRNSAPYFIDKMPNNFMHIGLIKLILPRAKIIDARRHPMACCFSGFKQLFGEGQEFSYGLESMGRYYKAYVELMAHWDKVLPGFVLRVQHEEVINDLEGQVRRILDFCGLPFEEACLEFHRTERSIKTPSSEQVRQPIYRSGMLQWQNFGTQLQPLTELLNLG